MTPTGPIRTKNPSGGNFGIDWERITRWEDEALQASGEYTVPYERILAHIVIESGGDPSAVQRNNSNGWSYGLMQVVPRWHGDLIRRLSGTNFHSESALGELLLGAPLLAIRCGTAILNNYRTQHGSWDKASSAFFLGNPDWRGQDTVNGNTGEGYRRSLNGLIEEYGEGETPVADPVIYDLRRDADARRFGLTPAERDRILAKRTANRNGASVQGIGLHVQAGFTSGSLRHWLGVSASSTVMVQQDGSILNVINPWDAPWTQGDVNKPDAMAADMRRRFGNDPNMWSLTIEAEDGNTHVINAKQAETIRWQIRRWQRDHPALAGTDWEGRILGHYQINSMQKPFCGTYRNEMVASLRDTPAPAPVPVFTGLPAWLPEDAFRVAFPLADPTGVVTKKVIEVVNATKQVPFFIGKVDVGNGRNLWRFEDFTLLNDGATVWREGEAA